jgi:uncharacterized protein with PQ loop repeat
LIALLSLLAMLFWGMILGFGYQCFLRLTERKTHGILASFLWYTVSGCICFLLTAIFLYIVDRGQWGIYGFLCMVGGFFLYHQKLWRRGERVVDAIFGAGYSLGGSMFTVKDKAGDIAVFPFGRIVDKGEKVMETAEKQWAKRKKERAVKAAAEQAKAAQKADVEENTAENDVAER